MKLESMFKKDINRDINGVVMVGDEDQGIVTQEL